MLCALRDKYPKAFIAWVLEPAARQLLDGHPNVDRFVTVPKGWLGRPRNWMAMSGQLRKLQFDYAIDPQGMTKSAMLGRLSGARRRIGIRGSWGRELSPWLNNWLVQTSRPHLVDRSLELLMPLGVVDAAVQYRLVPDDDSLKFIEFHLERLVAGDPFVVINPGASWPSKRWEADRFAAVARYLMQAHSLPSIISWAGQFERELAESIVANSNGSARLAPVTDLKQLAALLKKARYFIGCDTGPLHIACAVGTRCIGLYGSTLPSESGAYGPKNIAVQRWHQTGTSRQRRAAANHAMRDINVHDVEQAVDQMQILLGQSSSHDQRAA
jgi:ADP-heptose:LPS heptosyltransferase